MSGRFALVTLFIAMQAISSVFAQGRPVPVTDPDTPLQFEGFRIKPPPGKDWYIGIRDERNVAFGKRIESRTHSFVAVALSRGMPDSPSTRAEFFEAARKFKAAGMEPQRQTMLEQEFIETDTPAPDCLRYRIKVSDRGAPYAKGEPLLIELFGVVCQHPNSRKHLVDANYSERGGPRPSSTQMREEGESFLRSLVFTAIN